MDTMSVVSYYNHPAAANAMYRSHHHLNQAHHHPQTGAPPPPTHHQYHPHHPNSMSWYSFNGGQTSGTSTYANCMEEQSNLWNSSHSHPPPPPPPPPPPNQNFADIVVDYPHHPHNNLHHHHHHQQLMQHQPHMEAQHHNHHENHQLPSPPITVSGSELSSPGAASGNVSPPNNNNNPLMLGVHQTRPPPVRSPFEWIKKTNYTTQPNPGPGRTRTSDKYRSVYTDHQRHELEKEFQFVNKYITIRRKHELSSHLSLTERQIKIWFQNRRAKERRQRKKRTDNQGMLLSLTTCIKTDDDKDIDDRDEEEALALPSCRMHEGYNGRRAYSTPILEGYEYNMLRMREQVSQDDLRQKCHLSRDQAHPDAQLINVPPPLPSPPLIVADYNRGICSNVILRI